jgi:alkylhydroperoxidase family enzyme
MRNSTLNLWKPARFELCYDFHPDETFFGNSYMDLKTRAGTNPETKIRLIEDADATGDVATVYDEWRAHSGRQKMPGILKCFSHRPDFLREVMSFSNTVHFSEGHLTRKTKEAIASWVSWLNRCPY